MMPMWLLLSALCLMRVTSSGDSAACQQQNERYSLLVSTLDGQVTSLDVGTGQEQWSIDTGRRPLLSSSISNFEMMNDGVTVRLIPSLDGALYQYDGAAIEPVPLSSNLLLSNSFRFSDDSTVVGGEEVETFGINLQKGQLRYACSPNGCRYVKGRHALDDLDMDDPYDDTLVITRRTKTVRTVHMRSGQEKWNFSVGQHELSFIKSRPANFERDKVFDQDCHVEDEYENFFEGFDFSWFTSEEDGSRYTPSDLQIKVIVPSGIIIAVMRNKPSQVVWQHKLNVPIARAWLLRGDDLSEVDLFDNENIPALSIETSDTIPDGAEGEEDELESALLYIGVFANQVYVQPSMRLMQDVHEATTKSLVTGDYGVITMPRVHWQPYLATAFSRTPIVQPKRIDQGSKGSHNLVTEEDPPTDSAQYPFDEGVYLLQDYTPLAVGVDRQIEDKSQQHAEKISQTVYLISSWREVMLISLIAVVVSVVVHLVMSRSLFYVRAGKPTDTTETEKTSRGSTSKSISEGSDHLESNSSQTKPGEDSYTSRFYTDFEPTAVLGKGGFGVVFGSRNRLDDCVYAIKRITLNNSEKAREKVMREVKALAKLEHMGIVRYHQAWFESPPSGWQELQDADCLQLPTLSPEVTATEVPTSVASVSAVVGREDAPLRRLSQLFLCNLDKEPVPRNPLYPFREESEVSQQNTDFADSWVSDQPETSATPDVTGEFSVTFELGDESTVSDEVTESEETESDEGGSYGLSQSPKQKVWPLDDSFEVVFGDMSVHTSSADSSEAHSKDTLPFSGYRRDSEGVTTVTSHAMEDSGCGDRGSGEHQVSTLSPPFSTTEAVSRRASSKRSKSLSLLTSKCEVSSGDKTPVTSSSVVSKPSGKKHKKSASMDLSLPLVSSQGLLSPRGPAETHTGKQGHATVPSPLPKLYLYIQMQLCKQETLKDWLVANMENRDRLLLLDIFHQIVSAMDYVHNMGLMHRDLKPSNIFFSMDGLVKIGDFGLVTAQEEFFNACDESPITPVNPRHTGLVGTKLYMSPEQDAGKHYTHKVDVYAMGLIFFELFNPFNTQMERIHCLTNAKRHIFPEQFQNVMSPDEIRFVKSLLNVDPDKRPATSEILSQKMFVPFEEIQKAFLRARAWSGSRIRTCSTSSGNSKPDPEQ